MTLKLFLLYNDEDISLLVHPNIIPLKLAQTPYFESEAFRMLDPATLPDVDNIGFITPSLFKSQRTISNILNDCTQPLTEIYSILPSQHFPPMHTLEQALSYHGIPFYQLWVWLLFKLETHADAPIASFYRNFWVAPRQFVCDYLIYAKQAINILDNPGHMHDLLFSNSRYDDGKLTTNQCIAKFQKPYYTFHTFLMERLICVFAYNHGLKRQVPNGLSVMNSTKLYLLYTDDCEITFTHPDVIPYKIPKTGYYESEAFRTLSSLHLPNVANIGFITPAVFKHGVTVEDILKATQMPLDYIYDIVPSSNSHDCVSHAVKSHGINFYSLFIWLLYKLQIYANTSIFGFYKNWWVAPRHYVIDYLRYAKQALDIIDSPGPMGPILFSDSNYKSETETIESVHKRFGTPYIAFHPFLMEYLPCAYAHWRGMQVKH